MSSSDNHGSESRSILLRLSFIIMSIVIVVSDKKYIANPFLPPWYEAGFLTHEMITSRSNNITFLIAIIIFKITNDLNPRVFRLISNTKNQF